MKAPTAIIKSPNGNFHLFAFSSEKEYIDNFIAMDEIHVPLGSIPTTQLKRSIKSEYLQNYDCRMTKDLAIKICHKIVDLIFESSDNLWIIGRFDPPPPFVNRKS